MSACRTCIIPFRTTMTVVCALCLACRVAGAGEGSIDDARALGDAAVQQCASVRVAADLGRCRQLLHRLGRGPARHEAAIWRADFGRGVTRLAWGMPGCPVERKVAAGGGAMTCDAIDEAVAAFERRPLLMHVVKDAMDWQHFDTHAVLSCPYKCLWAGAVDPPHLADVLVYDCLQLPPPSGC